MQEQSAKLQATYDQQSQTEGGPLPGEITDFYFISKTDGPIDFKRNLAGQADKDFLGGAGNFAYYSIGSRYIPTWILDAGASAYALNAVRKGLKSTSELASPMFIDASAARVRNAALMSNGCRKP